MRNFEKKRYGITFGIVFIGLMLLAACQDTFDPAGNHIPIEDGYGRISISITGGEASPQMSRTVLPPTAFDRYEYTFNRVGGASTVVNPDNGYFTLEVGTYTVKVDAYIGTSTLVASGTSSQFSVGSGINAPVEVRLSEVNTGGQGTFNYTITYPAGATADITLQKWPGLTDVTLNPVTSGNGKSQTLDLDAGSYLLTVHVNKSGFYAGINEAIHINPSLSTTYTKCFDDDDLLALRTPLISHYDISGRGAQIYDGNEKTVTITPAAWLLPRNSPPGAINVFYEGIGTTTYAKTTTAPVDVGTYTVTFDVEAAAGWSAAPGLHAGFIVIGQPSFTVTNNDQWNDVLDIIRKIGSGPYVYTITISGNVSIASAFNLGNLWGIEVTLKGNGVLSRNSNGPILSIGSNQKVIIDDDNLILNGRNDNTSPLVWIDSQGNLELKKGTIRNNTSNFHVGGVYVNGIFTMAGGNITNNTGPTGAVVVSGTSAIFTMTDGIINNNNGYGFALAGGINIASGTFNMRGGTISDNVYDAGPGQQGAGGVRIGGGNFNMEEGTISKNEASGARNAGGVFFSMLSGGSFSKTGGSIFGNDSPDGNTTSTAEGHAVLLNVPGVVGGATVIFYYHNTTLPNNSSGNFSVSQEGNNIITNPTLSSLTTDGQTLNGWTLRFY